MAILLMDGFGNLTDGEHVSGTSREILGDVWSGYAAKPAFEDLGDGRKWIYSDSGISGERQFNLTSSAIASPVSTVRFAFRVLRSLSYNGTLYVFNFRTASDEGGNVSLGNNEVAWRYGTTTVLSADVLPAANTHVEIAIGLATDATGWVRIYYNGAEVASVDNVRTASATASIDRVVFASVSLARDWRFTDFVWHTNAGPIGDCGVFYRPANADGASSDFTPSAGADNYAMVDEIGPDEDTTYNESDGTAGHRDAFEQAGVASNLVVLAVAPMIRARKTDTGAGTIKVGLEHDGDEVESAAKALSESYLTFMKIFEDCPDETGWTPTQVGDTELFVEVGA